MRITALALEASRGWPELRLDRVDGGLNVFHGPAGSGKTTLADFVAHVLYGRRLAPRDGADPTTPSGELIVEDRGQSFRLRRRAAETAAARLTVSAVDGSAVDRDTVARLAQGLPSALVAELFAVDFREPSRLVGASTERMIRELQSALGFESRLAGHRAELIQRRDALAEQLEARIAAQRRQGRELDARWQELERLVHERKQELEQLRDRLRGVETELAEIDASLRIRRAEVGDAARVTPESGDWDRQLTDLDDEINSCRATIATLDPRRENLHGRLAQRQPHEHCFESTLVEQRASLAATRLLLADLEGEVARLARASHSDECVCGDAHPRLRPVTASLRQQIDELDALADRQQQAARAIAWADEAHHLARSQAQLRDQLEFLLQRREIVGRVARQSLPTAPAADNVPSGQTTDQQLSARRFELWRERGRLHERLAVLKPQLRDLRRERDTIERQRTDVLAPRQVRELERKIADVQRKLEHATTTRARPKSSRHSADMIQRASEFLAQVTDGEFVELRFAQAGRDSHVVDRTGDSRPLESLLPMERDQVGMSLSLALASIAAGRGAWLPLVLDEPFERLNARATTALAAVLDELGRRGHQVLVFTAQPAAIERFASLRAALHDMAGLFRSASPQPLGLVAPAAADGAGATRRSRRGANPKRGQKPGRTKRREAG